MLNRPSLKDYPGKSLKNCQGKVLKNCRGEFLDENRTARQASRDAPHKRDEEKPHASALHDSGKQARRCLPVFRHDRRGDGRGERKPGREAIRGAMTMGNPGKQARGGGMISHQEDTNTTRINAASTSTDRSPSAVAGERSEERDARRERSMTPCPTARETGRRNDATHSGRRSGETKPSRGEPHEIWK